MNPEQEKVPPPAAPWWRQGVVWGLIAGPAIVVVAGVVTAVIAADGADTLVSGDYYRRGVEINRQLATERAQMPAHQARNHAATPTRQP
ncbi:FixH family protein [Ramlibacter sp.]|uniref:FixH family protein n=1 Tax=Ramlibacter sp. TaxID=1917967 RepID=UPI002D4E9876|nr:FixH family protein [Ramlibacter sp.]HYD76991.1 FixH family protein [Ramlibacter sp.]